MSVSRLLFALRTCWEDRPGACGQGLPWGRTTRSTSGQWTSVRTMVWGSYAHTRACPALRPRLCDRSRAALLLQQRRLQDVGVETDDEPPTALQGWGAELPRAAQHHAQELLVRGPGVLQVDVDTLFAFGHEEVGDALQQLQCGFRLDGVLTGALYLPVGDVVLRKKLLRAFAARSARAVVAPLEVAAHACLRWMMGRPNLRGWPRVAEPRPGAYRRRL